MRRGLVFLLTALLVAAVALLMAIQHEFALKWVAERIVSSSNGHIVLNGVSGSLTGTIKIEEAVYQTPERKITAEEVEMSWQPLRILLGRFRVDSITLSRLAIENLAPSESPFVLPKSLAPPVSIHVEKVEVDQLKYDSLLFRDVHFSLVADKTAWELREAGFESPFGTVTAELKLDARAPFSLDGRADVKHEKADGAAQLAGNLQDIRFDGQFAGFGADVKASARITPFAAFVLPSLSLTADNVDPSQVSADWPKSRIQAKADIQMGENESVKGTIRIDNRIPGTIDAGQLPLKSMTAILGGDSRAVLLDQLSMDMGAAGRFSGKGRLGLNGVDLSLHTGRLNLGEIHSSIRKTAISGNILISAEETRQIATVRLAENRLSLDARAVREDDQVNLAWFRLHAGGGEMQLKGNIRLSGARPFVFEGRANRFNLSALGRYPASDINAALTGKGQLSPVEVSLNYVLQPSRFLGNPLTGRGRLTATAQSLRDVDVRLALGGNTLNANGAFGRSGERLAWKLEAPELSALGQPFKGAVTAEGDLAGSFETLQAQLTLDGRNLVLPGALRAGSIHAEGRFSTRLTDPLNARIQAENVAVRDMQWQALQFQASGTLQSHIMDAAARNDVMDLDARAAGGFRKNQGWRGEIQSLENRGKYPFSLTSPAPLHVGARLFSLQDFILAWPDGRLSVNRLEKKGSRIRSDGSAKRLPLRYLTALVPALAKKAGGNLVLGADWSVDMDRELTGKMHVYRESGDLTIRGEDASIKLGLAEMDFRLNLQKNELEALASLKGDTVGTVQLAAQTRLVRNRNGWHFPGQSPFRLLLEADMPTLGWISTVSGQPDIDVGGSLKIRINGAGTIDRPYFTGTLAGNALSFRWYTWGVKLHDGQLLARFDNNRITLEEAVIRGDEGVFRIEGGGSLDHGDMRVDVNLFADKLLLLSSPEKQLALSGQARMVLDNEKVTLNGQWRVDRALIQSVEYNNVSFSRDVVVIGREERPGKQERPLGVVMDMSVDLGDRFKIDGWGLNARLEGRLQAVSSQEQTLRIFGNIQAVDATFNAYGQKLDVRRGNVVFSGPPDRPSLDILAVRKIPTFGVENAVEAGVQIRGTPQNPDVRLVSNPNVSDSEKLSWLILGRSGLQNADDHDRSVVAAAAAALMSASSLGGMQSGLASTIGVDEIGVGAGADMESAVLSVSKKLSDRLFLSYEQGISTVSNLIRLRYIISNRMRIEAATGTSSAIDLLYEWSFD